MLAQIGLCFFAQAQQGLRNPSCLGGHTRSVLTSSDGSRLSQQPTAQDVRAAWDRVGSAFAVIHTVSNELYGRLQREQSHLAPPPRYTGFWVSDIGCGELEVSISPPRRSARFRDQVCVHFR